MEQFGGGEILKCELTSFDRLAALEVVPLPGGDAAAAEPWRMAASLLYKTQGAQAAQTPFFNEIEQSKRTVLFQMLAKDFNCPLTSSCGRLFDAVSALLGLNYFSTYEGQAAMLLESCARKAVTADWKKRLTNALHENSAQSRRKNNGQWEIISSEFVKKVVYDVSSGKNRAGIALRFHTWLICSVARLVESLSQETGIKEIVLSGGCMQNELLLEGLIFVLTEMELTPITGSRIPINDGGISIGQAVIGGLQHVSRSTHESGEN